MTYRCLTKPEYEVMKFFWSLNREAAAKEVLEYFAQKHWRRQAVYTFLKRLQKCGYLSVRKTFVTKYYLPLITEKEYQHLFNNETLDYYQPDSLGKSAKKKALTQEEIEKIKDLISKLD